MKSKKPRKLTKPVFAFRVTPELMERIRKAAAKDHRSVANWIECAIAQGVEKMGIR